MIITNAKYSKDTTTNENISIGCLIDGKSSAVPLDLTNRHYAEILRQVDAGTLTIAAAD